MHRLLHSRGLTAAVLFLALAWLLYRLGWLGQSFDAEDLQLELNADGRLFLLEKKGSSDIYLFGTVALNDSGVLALPKSVRDAFDASTLFATDAIAVPKPSPDGRESDAYLAYMRQSAQLCFRPAPFSLRSQIGSELFDPAATRLLALVDAATKELEALDRAMGEPWTLTDIDHLTLPCLAGFLSRSSEHWVRQALEIETLDEKMLASAVDEAKTIVHLASFEERYAAIAAMDEELGLESLRAALSSFGYATLEAYEASIVEAYLQGRLNRIDWLSSYSERYKAFAWTHIFRASQAMAEQVLSLAGPETLFVAVDATNLNGRQGIVNLLALQGYSVTVLEPPP